MPMVKDSSGLRLRSLKARMSRVVEDRIFRGVSQFLTAIFIIISHTNNLNLRKCKAAVEQRVTRIDPQTAFVNILVDL